MSKPAGENPIAASSAKMITEIKKRDAVTPATVRKPTAAMEPSAPRGESFPEATARLRVLHVFSYLGLGGTELTAIRVAKHLGKDRFENRLCGVRGFDPQVLSARCPDLDIVSLPIRRDKFRVQLFSLMNLIKAYRPHIVHSRNWGAIEAVPAARLAGVPIVVHSEHGYEMETLDGLPERRRLFRRAIYAMADAVFTVTEELREYHARQARISPSRIRVIHNGIDTELFTRRPQDQGSGREKFGIGADSLVVGSVGRLVPIKDHATLLKAAEVLVRRGVNVHVLLAGSGPELIRHQQYLENSTALSGRVSFLGASDNVPAVLNALDVFVLSSVSEGMSNTLLEAMACSLPVVATRVGGNTEVIGDGGSGLLFAPGDVDGLAQHLERLARNEVLGRNLGLSARQRVVSLFSLQRMIADYRHLYLELAAKRGICAREIV